MSGRRPREVKIDFRSNPRWRSCRHWNLLNRYKLNCGLCDVVKVSHYVPGGRWAGWASSSGNASLIATFLVIFDITSSVRLSCVCQLANARYILAYLYLIIIIIIIYNVVTLSTTFAACMSGLHVKTMLQTWTSRFLQLYTTESRSRNLTSRTQVHYLFSYTIFNIVQPQQKRTLVHVPCLPFSNAAMHFSRLALFGFPVRPYRYPCTSHNITANLVMH